MVGNIGMTEVVMKPASRSLKKNLDWIFNKTVLVKNDLV
jgi:hypothetical protein